jgi:hypothetical protein
MKFLFRQIAVGALAWLPLSCFACSSCGCTLSSDWDSQGFSTSSGFRFDLRYDYLNQAQLRSGTGVVDRADYPPPQDREIELDTINRYTTLGVDYSPNADWGVNVQLPYLDRSHRTVTEDETEISSSRSRSFGDARVLIRYQGFSAEHNKGIQFGLKLPTGRHDVVFSDGPETGNPLDRGLQPGSGGTDALLGAYKFGTINQDWDYFVEGQMQAALGSSDHFRSGASLNLNAGLRYMANETFIPQIQINARSVRRDSGDQADQLNSGGTLVDISPGLSVKLAKNFSLYGFVQLPLYQHVNGFQLAPRATASIGARFEL